MTISDYRLVKLFKKFFAEDMFVQVSQTIHKETTIHRSEGNSSDGSGSSYS
jgi:hypothetical protein